MPPSHATRSSNKLGPDGTTALAAALTALTALQSLNVRCAGPYWAHTEGEGEVGVERWSRVRGGVVGPQVWRQCLSSGCPLAKRVPAHPAVACTIGMSSLQSPGDSAWTLALPHP